MKALNLPAFEFKIITRDEKKMIFDKFRKRYVVLTPEEWVRQNFLMYLTVHKNYPVSLIAVETGLDLYKRKKRSDIVVYNKSGAPLLIVECKAPSIKINQKAFDQITRYNMVLNVKYLIVTNGYDHFCCQINYKNQTYSFLEEIPDYITLLT